MALSRASVEVLWLLCWFLYFMTSFVCFSFESQASLPCFSKSAKLDGRTCEYNNKIYQNGEIFRPNCKHQCTCMDGAVGCVSFCPHELMLSKLGCALPRRVKVPGRCCKQLICPKRREENTVVKRHMKKPSKDGRASENDLANGNELTSVWRGGSESLPGEHFYILSLWLHLEPLIRRDT